MMTIDLSVIKTSQQAIVLSKTSHTENDKYYIISYMESKKNNISQKKNRICGYQSGIRGLRKKVLKK